MKTDLLYKGARNVTIDDSNVEEWLAACKREAITIDPETAEVTWRYAQTFDPYGVDPDLPEEYQQVGREFFARRPAGDIWVWFGDLPRETQNRLVELRGRRSALSSELLWKSS